MSKTDYMQLKAEVVSFVSNNSRYPKLIEELKNLFTSDIDSPKRQERISTIEELIKVLEIRGTLSEDNVIAFRKIANKLPGHSSITEAINSYQGAFVNNINQDLRYPNKVYPNSTKIDLHSVPNDNLKSISERKKELIYETIKQELGKYWMELGRNLGIREHKLNKINSSYNNTYDKASKLLKYYEYEADSYRWFHVLCEALEESKRKDLTRHLQSIMMMND